MRNMMNEVHKAMGNIHFLYLYGCSLVLLFILMKGRRRTFLLPGLLITAAVINPAFYYLWNHINDYAYWRTIWMIPFISVCAAVPAILVEKRDKSWIKICVVVIFAIVVSFTGSFIYKQTFTTFIRAENAEKLPNDMVMVADALLELDETPSVVAEGEICVYLRQYSGKIRLLFARNITWGGAGKLATNVYEQLTKQNGDLNEVNQIMLNYDYEYLVTDNEELIRNLSLQNAGFDLVKQVKNYRIFQVVGNKTEKRTYNEKHQVIALTYVDEDGKPMNGPKGFATATYSYNRDGRIAEEFYLDVNGNPVLDASGKAGYQRTYDRKQLVTKEIWIGTNKEPVESDGYSMRTCIYNRDKKLIREEYFNTDEEKMLRTDTLYAEKTLAYDNNGNIIKERYYGLDDQLTIGAAGYAGFDFIYNENNKLLSGTYKGIDDEPMMIPAGYYAFKRDYDESGNIAAEYYYDGDGNSVLCDKGYASVHYEYDEEGRVIHEWYEDTFGKGAIIEKGYAGFTRKYDSAGNVIEEIYLGTDGNEMPGKQGYSKVCRVFDGDNRIIHESYYNNDIPFSISAGYAAFFHFYDQSGNLVEERFFDEDNHAVTISGGYAIVRHKYDSNGRRVEDTFFDTEDNAVITTNGYAGIRHVYNDQGMKKEDQFLDTNGDLAVINMGYSKCRFSYTDDGQVSLVYYFDKDNRKLEAGSGFLHEYLQALKERNVSIFIVAKDEASGYITETICKDMKALGFDSDLRGQYRKSYYAVSTPEKTTDEISEELLCYDGITGGVSYSLTSAGWLVGNRCSIEIDGKEYAKNVRGLNIVVMNNETQTVIESIAFDTCAQEMTVTK